ncbi:MAG TPA: CPBP family intramembrane glutamic endopeptidase [Thermoanaerobaculia bacterium]
MEDPVLPPRFHPLVRSALFLGAYLVVQVVLGVAIALFAQAVGSDFFKEGGFTSSTEIQLLGMVLAAPFVVAVTFAFTWGLDRRPIGSIGARWPEGGSGKALVQALTVPLATLALLGSWLAAILLLPPYLAEVRLGGVSGSFAAGPAWWPLPPSLLLVLLLFGFLIQGGLEEWIVRGYIYRALKERWRPWVAALASSVLFALLHLLNPDVSPVALGNIVIAGMILAALVEKSGSLWSATLAHGVWNFAVACLLSVPVSGVRIFHLLDVSIEGRSLLTGGPFGPEGSLVLTVLGLLLAAWLWRGLPTRVRE